MTIPWIPMFLCSFDEKKKKDKKKYNCSGPSAFKINE